MCDMPWANGWGVWRAVLVAAAGLWAIGGCGGGESPAPKGSATTASESPAVEGSTTAVDSTTKKAYVCMHRADLHKKPGAPGRGQAEGEMLFFATELDVKEVKGCWVKVAVAGKAAEVWVHRALVCGDREAVRRMARTGVMPNFVMAFEGGGPGGEVTGALLGGDVAVSLSKEDADKLKPDEHGVARVTGGDGLTLEKMEVSPGDCLWFADDAAVRAKKEFPLKGFGISTPLASPTPLLHYAFDGMGGVMPLEELLAREEKAMEGTPVSGVLAFRCPAALCPAPRDVFWAEELGGFVVADAKNGILFLSADPVQGVRRTKRIAREGQGAQFVGIHSRVLLVGWSGKRNELAWYASEKDGVFEAEPVIELPYPPTAFGTSGKDSPIALVGTASGHLLAVDKSQAKVVADVAVCKGPILDIEAGEERLWAACGGEGLAVVDIRDPKSPKLAESLAKLAPVSRVTWRKEDDREVLMLGGEKGGVRIVPANRPGEGPTAVVPGSDTAPAADIREGSVTGGMVMKAKGQPAILLVGAGKEGLCVYAGAKHTAMKASHRVPVPCFRAVWGSQLLACASPKALWFVSLSEVLPHESTGGMHSIHGDGVFELKGGGMAIKRASAHGIADLKGRDGFARGRSWRDGPRTDKGLTIVERGETLLAIGDYNLVEGDLILFRPGVKIMIGKGGATIAGRRYAEGAAFELADDGTPRPIGFWRGMLPSK